ncbi:MAG: SDR family oxidoreductase [Actinobacteria bacterium]|nr:SDR family oxidoreductase [Actinomycetota bacterium]
MSAACLVVGGARRLGAALAVELAVAGADVAVSSRTPAAAAPVVARVEQLGRRAVAVGGDMSSRLEARHVVRTAARELAGLDLVVYAASGPFDPTPPEDLDEAAWDGSMDVIARGLLFCAQAAREVFLQRDGAQGHDGARDEGDLQERGGVEGQGGRRHEGVEDGAATARRGTVVALTDVVEGDLWPRLTPHFAAKAAQIMTIRLLAAAWQDDGVAVSGVAPGPVDVPDDERRAATERAARRLGYPRLLRPAEVTAMVLRCTREPGLNGGSHVVRA